MDGWDWMMWVPGRGILNGMGMYSLVWSRECGVVSVWFESAIRAFCCVSFVAINSACKVQTLARVSHQEVKALWAAAVSSAFTVLQMFFRRGIENAMSRFQGWCGICWARILCMPNLENSQVEGADLQCRPFIKNLSRSIWTHSPCLNYCKVLHK